MDLLSWIVVGGVAWLLAVTYKNGKRAGSRKGYHVGRCRGRRH